MDSALERLVAIGFQRVGEWGLVNQVLRLKVAPSATVHPEVLYAFAVDGLLTYIGKSTQGLLKRMQGYRSPATNAERGGSTNIKNNRNIVNALSSGSVVEIYVLDSLPVEYRGEFTLNLSAGLEDGLIRSLTPIWNGRGVANAADRKNNVVDADPRTKAESATSSPTAFRTGPGCARTESVPRSRNSAVPSVEALFAFCRTKQGQTLTTTVRRSRFCVEVDGTCIAITPESSRAARREGKAAVRALLDRLARTQSFQMSDYRDVTFNASYLLSLVRAWQVETASHESPVSQV